MTKQRSAILAAVAMAAASACLPQLPEPNPGIPDAAVVLCGAKGQPCCSDSSSPCNAALRCAAAEGLCVDEERRYCISDEQCAGGQACCISGLVGSCESIAPGAACPQADLVLELSRESLALAYSVRTFDPAKPSDACAIQKGCVGGAGERQLLHFSTAVRNAGQADLLFGATTPPAAGDSCDAQANQPHYLDYSLVNAAGQTLARGGARAPCAALPSSYASQLDCSFNGLRAGWSQLLTSRPISADASCQWLDITGVAPGDYVLRVQVNQQALLAEARLDNNRAAVPIRLPAFDDPTQACPPGPEGSLLGSMEGRDCGWRLAAGGRTCTPGQQLQVDCATCRGDPMLRVCPGTRSCTFADASSARFDGLGVCPTAEFTCPANGSYGVYWAPVVASTAGAACRLSPSRNVGF